MGGGTFGDNRFRLGFLVHAPLQKLGKIFVYKAGEAVFLARPTRVNQKDAPLVPGSPILMFGG